MVVTVKIPNLLHQNLSRWVVDLPVISFHFMPNSCYPLRVGERLVHAQCDLPLLEPSNFILKIMSWMVDDIHKVP